MSKWRSEIVKKKRPRSLARSHHSHSTSTNTCSLPPSLRADCGFSHDNSVIRCCRWLRKQCLMPKGSFIFIVTNSKREGNRDCLFVRSALGWVGYMSGKGRATALRISARWHWQAGGKEGGGILTEERLSASATTHEF